MKLLISILIAIVFVFITTQLNEKEIIEQHGIKEPTHKTLKLRPKRAYKSVSKADVAIIESEVKTPQSAGKTYTGSIADWLFKLRMCEAGGNYKTNTGNGYYGAYQFSLATWNHWNTGYARADLAPPSVQDATIIKNTLASAGLMTQNPGCYASTGLSNKPPQ